MHDIIIIGADPWEHYTWRRRHHIAWNLAKKNRVLFVEPPLTLLQPFNEIDLSWRHVLNLGRLKHQGRNLFTYSPFRKFPLSLPFLNIFDYEKMNREDIVKNIKRIVSKLRFKDPILWIYYHPLQYDYSGLFNEKIVVADWYDKFTAESGGKKDIDKIESRENCILKQADIVFAVSKELAKDIENKHANVHVIPHGVDVDSFNNGLDRNNRKLKQLKLVRRPILGFLGIMHYVVDFNLLNHIAEEKPEWSILLMGKEWLRSEEDVRNYQKLRSKKNVFYTGEIKRELIPPYLKFVDVCLMPFKKVDHVWYSAPLKLWEYMASGKPIVSIDHGMESSCDKYIYRANNKDQFVSMIKEALDEPKNSNLSKERINVAMENSWSSRVEEMMRIVDSCLQS